MATKELKVDKKTLKFAEIKAMFEGGIMALSSRTLDVAHAYKVAQFKVKIKNAYSEFENRHQQNLKEAGIDDSDNFFKRLQTLANNTKRTEEEKKELDELIAKNERLNQLFSQLLNDDYVIEPKVMPYEQWHLLQEANKDIKNGNLELLAQFEIALEGILWSAPEE